MENKELNLKSFGFSTWTSEIDFYCDEFYPDLQPEDLVGFSFAKNEDQLRDAIANIFPQMKKYLDN